MPSTEIDRRTLLRAIGGAWLALGANGTWGEAREKLYVSARADATLGYRISAFAANGEARFDLPLPARGHSIALHPKGPFAVCFARRPGTFAVLVDLEEGIIAERFETPLGRHFYGHGVFASDGRLLYASENDYANERGVIGVYDCGDGYRRTGEISSHGIGPHELGLLSDGETLVVANGGIATHPDAPGVKLNVPSMESSLVYMSRRDGRLLEQVRLSRELHRLGIRHLAVAPDDRVAIAMQYEGPGTDRVPLLALHAPGHGLRLFDAPEAAWRAMHQYCGSVAFDGTGRIAAASAPRGNVITLWDAQAQRYLRRVALPDGCGVVGTGKPGQFLASSGRGGAAVIDAREGTTTPLATGLAATGLWDNHVVLDDTRPASR